MSKNTRHNKDLQKQFLIELGQKMKLIRLEKKYSQAEVAHRCGKETQSYQRVESGNTNPTIWYLQHIAAALEVDIKEFFDDDLTKPKL